jgi:putative ABC transport system ATP-binding protein
VEELSGGQQQRVAVARALVAGPRVVVADEPTAELDRTWREVVVTLLREAASAGAAVVLATHDEEVAAACDGGLHLTDGRVSRRW